MKKLRHSNSIKKTCVSLLSAMVVLVFVSCDPDDENDGRGDKASKSLQSLGFSVSVENQKTSTRSDMASAGDESFTFTIGENNDCEITCLVTDMEGNTSVSPTRGTPVGTTVPYNLDGTIPVISEVTNSIESMYGTDGIAITAYRKDKDDNVSLLVPNSETKDKVTENANSVPYFQNLKYTYSATAFEGVGSWITEAAIPGYYWHKDDKLCFYTVAPATLTPDYTPNATSIEASFDYTVPTDNADQKDVLIGATGFLERPTIIEDKDYNMELELPTYHALCAVRFVIDNREIGTAPSFTQRSKDFTLNSITLTNLKTGGTCTYTYNSSSSAKSADCIEWDLISSSTGDYFCNFGTSGSGTAIAKANTTYNLHSADGSASGTQLTNVFLLVPQDLTENTDVQVAYTRSGRNGTISGHLLGHGATETDIKGKLYGGTWQAGKMYTYVISSKYINPWKVGETEELLKDPKRFDSTGKSSKAQEVGSSLDITDLKTISLMWWHDYKGLNKIIDSGADGDMSLWIIGKDKDGNELSTKGQSISFSGSTWTGSWMGYDPSASTHPNPPKGSETDPLIYYFDVTDFITLQVVLRFCNSSGGGSSSWWEIKNLKLRVEEILPG